MYHGFSTILIICNSNSILFTEYNQNRSRGNQSTDNKRNEKTSCYIKWWEYPILLDAEEMEGVTERFNSFPSTGTNSLPSSESERMKTCSRINDGPQIDLFRVGKYPWHTIKRF